MLRKINNIIKHNKIKEKESAVLLLSFLLPLIMMIAILFSKKVFPFGNKCILRTDFYHQYLPFYLEFLFKLQNFKSLLYTYNVGLGTNFITLFAYYLSCPLNIFMFFVPENFVLEFMTLMIVLKISLCSLSMAYYLMTRYHTDSFVVLFFSIFYAMGGYVSAYYWNIMWLDNIVLFPILVLSFEDLQNGKRSYKYIFLLALSIICNYYIGTITCIFFIIYFIFYNILKEHSFKLILSNFIKTGIYTIIGVMISCILLIPIFYAFKTTASSDSSFPKRLTEYFTIIEVIARHLPFVKVENGIEYWPNLYSGVACFPLLILYFTSKKFKIREKICYAVFLIFFIASFSINVLDFVWHVFKYPNSLPARQSFIYTFILLSITIKPLLKLKSIKKENVAKCFAASICLIIIVQKLIENDRVKVASIYFGIIFIFIYLIIFLVYLNKKTNKNILLYIVISFVCFEAFINMYETSISTIKREDYYKNTINIKNAIKSLKTVTNDFYRVERATMKTKDDGAFMHFPSASIFSSSAYASGTDFYRQLGIEASTNAYSVTGSTPFTDSLLSVKYKVFEEEQKNVSNLNMREILNIDNVYVYQNIDTMPLSFMLDDDFLNDYDMSTGNPATNQNNFSRTLKLGTMLNKITTNINGIAASANIEEDGDYYAFVRDKGIKEVTVTFPTTAKKFSNLNRGFFIELGYLNKDTNIEFRNETNDDQLLIEVFKFDYDTLKKVKDNILSNADFKINNFSETYINYTIDAKIDGKCVVTLPYDSGFTVYVDGVEVEKEKTFDFFLSFNVNEGKHNIIIKYFPDGLKLGLILSIFGIMIYIYLLYKKPDFNFRF